MKSAAKLAAVFAPEQNPEEKDPRRKKPGIYDPGIKKALKAIVKAIGPYEEFPADNENARQILAEHTADLKGDRKEFVIRQITENYSTYSQPNGRSRSSLNSAALRSHYWHHWY